MLFLTSCSISQWYPITGAVIGAGGGSVAGAGGAMAGAAGGFAVGKGAQLYTDNEELVETVEALSKGEVDELVASKLKAGLKAGMESQKGALATAKQGIYDFIKWCSIGVILWNLIPLVYAMLIHKKVRKDGKAHEKAKLD